MTAREPRLVPPLTDPRQSGPLSFTSGRLDSGVEVLAVQRDGAPLVQLRLSVPFVDDDEAHPARARLLAETMLSGTDRRSPDEIAAALQSLGGELTVRVDPDRLTLRGDALASGLPDLLTLLGEVLTGASYPTDDVIGERNRLVEDVQMSRAQPSVLAREALLRRMFGGHPYGRELPETDQVTAVTPEDVRSLHHRRVLPDGSVLLLVGDIDPSSVLDQVATALSTWRSAGNTPQVPEVPPLEPGPVMLVDRPGSVQSSIRLGGEGLGRAHPGYAALHLANMVFGGYFSSRLTENIREDKGYTYSPHAYINHASAGSTIQIQADVANEVTAPALLEINYELGRMATLPVRTEELESARQYAIGSLALAISTQSGLADILGQVTASGLDVEWLQEQPRRLASVTVEQVMEQSRRFLAPAGMVTVVLGDAIAVEPSMRALGDVVKG